MRQGRGQALVCLGQNGNTIHRPTKRLAIKDRRGTTRKKPKERRVLVLVQRRLQARCPNRLPLRAAGPV